MTETLKVLGQVTPAAATLTTGYTVPGATTSTISSICVCNTNASNILFRISVAVAGASDTTSQYLYYDVALGGNDTFVATLGLTLGATDVIRVQSNTTAVSFNIFGVQVT